MRKYPDNFLYYADAGNELICENRLFSFYLYRVWYDNTTFFSSYHQQCLHKHWACEVRFVLKGESVFVWADGRCLKITAGEFVICPAKTDHYILHEGGCYSKFGFTYIIKPKVGNEENLYGLLNEYLKRGMVYQYSPNAAILIEQILRLQENPSCDYETNVLYLVLPLFMDLMNTVAADMEKTKLVQEARVRKAVKFINERLSSDINVSQIADHVGLSKKQLNRLFAAELGETVMKFVERARRKKIRELLLDPTLSLEDIARIMHYSDKMAFARSFKRAEGITPRQFRKNMRVDQI